MSRVSAAIFTGGALLTRLGLGIVFVYSGIIKITRPYDFLSTVFGYEIGGPTLPIPIAALLPFLEVILGVSLLAGVAILGSLLLVMLVLAVFAAAQIFVLINGILASCGCFGTAEHVSLMTVSRTGALLLLSAFCWFGTVAHARHSK